MICGCLLERTWIQSSSHTKPDHLKTRIQSCESKHEGEARASSSPSLDRSSHHRRLSSHHRRLSTPANLNLLVGEGERTRETAARPRGGYHLPLLCCSSEKEEGIDCSCVFRRLWTFPATRALNKIHAGSFRALPMQVRRCSSSVPTCEFPMQVRLSSILWCDSGQSIFWKINWNLLLKYRIPWCRFPSEFWFSL